MCEHGTDVELEKLLAFNGKWHRRTWKIDACIAPIVKALNEGGIDTTASCCGHGTGPGRIDLADGRVLLLVAATAGYGNDRLIPPGECGTCGGSGTWTNRGATEREFLEGLKEEPCPTCHGSGKGYPAELVDLLARTIFTVWFGDDPGDWAMDLGHQVTFNKMAVAVLNALNETDT